MQGVLGSTLSNSHTKNLGGSLSISLMAAADDLNLLASLFQLQPPEC